MSKNDNFIPIDQLFKNLRHGEERQSHDAWDQMDSLLNARMPLKKTVEKDYKYLLLPFLLLLAVGSGLYLFSYHNKAQNKDVAAPAFGEHGTRKNSIQAIQDDFEKIAADKQQSADLASADPKTAVAVIAPKPHSLSSPIVTPGRRDAKKKDDLSEEGFSENIHSGSEPKEHISNKPTADAVAYREAEIIEEQNVIEVIKATTKKSRTSISVGNEPTAHPDEKWNTETVYQHQEIVSDDKGVLYKKEENGSFKKYEITRKKADLTGHPGKATFLLDTISIVRIQKIKYTPLSRAETYAVNKLLLAANSPADMAMEMPADASSNAVNLLPLSDYRVKSKRINTFDALKQTTNGISSFFDDNHNLFAAVFLGGNATAGDPAAYGMQAGIAALFSFAERWTVSAEVKFLNKYFPNFSFQDQSKTYDLNSEQTENGWLFTGSEQETIHHYKVKNFNSFNLPIYLSYNLSERLSVFGGINFRYTLPLNYTKTTSFNTSAIHKTTPEGDQDAVFPKTGFEINETEDFKHRWGVGYLAGINYDLSRKVSLDGRIVHTPWDNSSSRMESLNSAFRKPSFELSLGFYFGRRDKVIYIMDRKQ